MLQDVFQEIVSWEKKPISELLGTVSEGNSEYSKQIIMYGPTQVGKTTLILDLIGIKEEKRSELDKILRGNSKSGCASTSSAIVYGKWDRDCFGIATRNIHDSEDKTLEELSPEQMKERITSINSQNRSGDKATLKRSDIYCFYLPSSYFDDFSPLKNLQIIDLPGFGERNEKMRKHADEIASFISGFAAGAVVVVRSQNIQKLESDYKEFINKHHINHLAIAVSYAAATNFDVRSGLIDTKDKYDEAERKMTEGEKTARRITEYYYNLIQKDGYMNFGDVDPEKIIFPVEKKSYLKENMPRLCEAFEETRKKLVQKIGAMNNGTAIEYCIERLELRNKNLLQEKEKAEQQKKYVAEKEAKDYENLSILNESKAKCDSGIAEINEVIAALCATRRRIIERAEKVKKENFSTSDAAKLWDSIRKKSDMEKRNAVYSRLRKYVDKCIGDKNKYNDKKLYESIRKTAEDVLNDFDVNYFLKAKGFGLKAKGFGFTLYGETWRVYAATDVSLFLDDLGQRVIDCAEEETNALEEKLFVELNGVLSKQAELNKGINFLEDEIKESERKQADLSEYILNCDEQIINNTKSKKNVQSVFIKHFYLKKQELEERMKNEPCPEMKAALFIVLSSIYLNMKPYLEESTNED